jgi:hypothetical protein
MYRSASSNEMACPRKQQVEISLGLDSRWFRGESSKPDTADERDCEKFSDQKLTLAERRTRVCWSTDRRMSLTGISLVI